MSKSVGRKSAIAAAVAATALSSLAFAPTASASTSPSLCTSPIVEMSPVVADNHGNPCYSVVGDRISKQYASAGNYNGTFQVQFHAGPWVDWWKGYRVEDANGNVLAKTETVRGARDSATFTLPASNTVGLKIVISKAGFLGIPKDVFQVPVNALSQHENIASDGAKGTKWHIDYTYQTD